ncbi:hypothetical protein N9D61_08880, partial [Planktomarina sp.]|nr:hypothetical protein [Planktomarina sp.]
MQTLRYLVSNRINILANEAGFVTEYKPVYSRTLTVYKGIDNVLEFRLLNPDQKPLDVDRYTPKFVAFDENNKMIIEHDGVNLQEGDSTAYTKKGLFSVTITENDLLNVKDQFLTYNIYLVDYDDTKVLTYANEWFEAPGILKVSGNAFPGPSASYSITTFVEDNDNWFSESITAEPAINGNEALHTAAIYTDSYNGDVVVQGTLENQVTGTTNWADIATVSFDGSTDELRPVNFNGVYT